MEKHHAKAPSSRLRRPCHHRPRLRRRIAVVYFTKTGNTKSLAEAVRHMTGAALFRVETVEPYPESYGSATEIVKDELQRGVIRPIRPLAFNPDDYDVVVLATPTWWHHAAMPLQTWIRSVDLSAKKILTASTHGAAASCTPARPSRRCSQAAGSARTSRSTGPCARRTQRSGKRLSLTPETQSRTGIRHGED